LIADGLEAMQDNEKMYRYHAIAHSGLRTLEIAKQSTSTSIAAII